LVAGFHQFGKISNEILKVGVVAHTNPGDGLGPYTPVELVGFEVGVMERKSRDGQVIGVQVWYRAEQLRAISSTASRRHQSDGS
ncbi:MAG: hypothetical protein LC808_43600, partial [Actinobacteria bacterium]|nr:hypothetical protein [Actinomycetota bacterium]